MLYIFSTLLSVLFYALLLVPVAVLILVLHSYLIRKLNNKLYQRVLLFGVLVLLITPLQLDSGNGALIDLTIPRPLYTFYLDMIYTGGIEILQNAVRLNPIFSVFGLVVSILVCGYLARRAYR